MSKLVRQEFIAELRGEINGQPIVVDGEGSILRTQGITSGTYLVRKLPDYFDPKLLAACLVTGYPSACAETATHRNPFALQNYSYRRQLTFSNGGKLTLEVACTQTHRHLESKFHLTGSLHAPEVGLPSEILERWVPSDSSSLHGEFGIVWGDQTSPSPLSMEALSDYFIEGEPRFQSESTRFIEVTPRLLSRDVLTLFQVSHLQ